MIAANPYSTCLFLSKAEKRRQGMLCFPLKKVSKYDFPEESRVAQLHDHVHGSTTYTTLEIALNAYPAKEKYSIAAGGLTVQDRHSTARDEITYCSPS
jgi:hypothetical protein